MSRKAVPLAESIGGFIRDEFIIAMGDMAKIIFKVHFLAGSSLKLLDPRRVDLPEHDALLLEMALWTSMETFAV